ncbi:MAG: hypothetical protein H7A36_04675 [Chlamydiales bacterium]|nr:hypothetical protein [Chlamydiales bacterium]
MAETAAGVSVLSKINLHVAGCCTRKKVAIGAALGAIALLAVLGALTFKGVGAMSNVPVEASYGMWAGAGVVALALAGCCSKARRVYTSNLYY